GGGSEPWDPNSQAEQLNPLTLQPQPLSFWRWPTAPQQGAALYFVADRPANLAQPLLLYVGETGQADQRWKGEHDCKAYLAAYSEALVNAELTCQLSIRFWLDVPAAIKPRRALEQALIQRWLPPFNKETRNRWATPFQAEPA
ncbi:MAG: GIY-YIG nuclease family protein, partial [Cyanobium sp.]